MTATRAGAPRSLRRYAHSLWLLSARDLRVRYATSWLGYLWSVLDPLVMSAIYWFVFTQIFHRAGEEPYIVFLIAALLPWVWFNAAVTDFTKAFSKDAKLVRSTSIPRSIWIGRIVLSKGVEFLCALPVLAIFVIANGATVGWGLLWFPVAILVQLALLVGLGLIVAPLCVLFSDLERTTRLILRALFYASPIIYSVKDLPDGFGWLDMANPLAGIFTMYRAGFFPGQWDTAAVVSSVVLSLIVLIAGVLTFRALERPVLKEL
ncbi:ABC transporter permease [Microbacterium sp. Marseille-Q6965]|uniref:ABC transporter permease n=1 Tax=Microbacterium sp. Marseille-Q6965 TaxID=2965072 RepID=UPI0021B71018|nr:ABC transporter permease [Microbacterium sp. Marseille-Q6965]